MSGTQDEQPAVYGRRECSRCYVVLPAPEMISRGVHKTIGSAGGSPLSVNFTEWICAPCLAVEQAALRKAYARDVMLGRRWGCGIVVGFVVLLVVLAIMLLITEAAME